MNSLGIANIDTPIVEMWRGRQFEVTLTVYADAGIEADGAEKHTLLGSLQGDAEEKNPSLGKSHVVIEMADYSNGSSNSMGYLIILKPSWVGPGRKQIEVLPTSLRTF
jgi:hypothetical protein